MNELQVRTLAPPIIPTIPIGNGSYLVAALRFWRVGPQCGGPVDGADVTWS